MVTIYTYISFNKEFSNLKSRLAKINYNRLISSLESILVPIVPYSVYYDLGIKSINKDDFEKYLKYLCDKVFLNDRCNLIAKSLVENRIQFELEGYPYGFTSYDTNKEKMIIIEGGKYKISPIIAMHELTHAITFVQKNSISKKYEEFLSMFIEMVSVAKMEEEVQDEWLFNRIAQRLSYRVYLKDLSDKSLRNHIIDNNRYFEDHFRLIDFVYALRLYEIYLIEPERVYNDVSCVFLNQISIEDLLKKYLISLENEDTILCFENKLAEYDEIVKKNFDDFQKNRIFK